jgi:hypothetical protein
MHRTEEDGLARCANCGEEMDGSRDRAFGFGEDGLLCWDCAVVLGGEYDPELETWVRTPDVSTVEGPRPAAAT